MRRLSSYREIALHPLPGALIPPSEPGEGWGAIVADPPWSFSDLGSRATPGYSFMSDAEIVALPVRSIRAPDSHLYLWAPDTHLELALEVVDAWGFDFKHLIPWVKMGGSGKLQIGLGHWFRKAHEVCLFAVSGKAKILDRGLPSVIIAPRTAHSAKPEELQDLAEKASPGPRLEMFARRQRAGWKCWGAETDWGDRREERWVS